MAAGSFDPYTVFHALDAERAFYVLIGGLARVLEGSDLIPEPEGTSGYEDLHRHARHEPLGEGLRITVASPRPRTS